MFSHRLRVPRIPMALLALVAILLAANQPSPASAAWPSTLGTTLNLADGPGDETVTDAAPDGLGGMLVVWTDDAAGNLDIYAQRIAADGTVMWGAGGLPVCTAAGDQANPRVVDDGSGGAIIIWQDERNLGGTQIDIYAQRIDAAGNEAWATDGVVVCDTFNNQTDPRLVTDAAGGAIAVWTDSRTGVFRIWGQRVDSDGVSVWTLDGIEFSPSQIAFAPALAADGQGGAWVVWRRSTDDLYRQRVDGGGAFALANGGVLSSPAYPASDPAIVPDGQGGYWIGYSFEDFFFFDEYLQVDRYDANDTSVTTGYLGTVPEEVRLVLAADGDGGVILAWPESFDVRLLRVTGGGQQPYLETNLPVGLSSGEEYAWDLVGDGVGSALLVARGNSINPIAWKIGPTGSLVWGANGLQMSFGRGDEYFAVSDGRNGVIGAWSREGVGAQKVDRHGYLGDPGPAVTSVVDHPGDQGGFVLSTWDASYLDSFGNQLITQYSVWRQDASGSSKQGDALDPRTWPATLKQRAATQAADLDLSEGQTLQLMKAGWELVGTQPAVFQTEYTLDTATYADSTVVGPAPLNVKVLAQTADPFLFWESASSQGQSVDNLAPGAPQGLVANYDYTSGNELVWEDAVEADFGFFRIYRGTSPDFTPDEMSLVGTSTEPMWTDAQTGGGVYYKVSIVDDAYNEGPTASPGEVTDVPVTPSGRVALHANAPNPFNPSTQIRFEIPTPGRVQVRVYDLAGRQVATLVDQVLPAGPHQVAWHGTDSNGRPVASGAYLYSLRAGDTLQTRKMVLVQ